MSRERSTLRERNAWPASWRGLKRDPDHLRGTGIPQRAVLPMAYFSQGVSGGVLAQWFR